MRRLMTFSEFFKEEKASIQNSIVEEKLSEDAKDLIEAWGYLLEVDLIDNIEYAEKIKEFA